ncbi:hypothetical protein ACWEOZ_09960 [Actinoplanes sp. NPDC004185]
MSQDTHHHTTGHRTTPRERRLTLLLLLPAVLATAIGMLLLWPHDAPQSAQVADGPIEATGEVRTVTPAPCPPTPEGQEQPGQLCGIVTVVVTGGADKGKQITTDAPSGPGAQAVLPGDDIVLLVLQDENGGTSY